MDTYIRKPDLDHGPYKVWEMVIKPYVEWNGHIWKFETTEEAMLFASYWSLK